MASFGLVVNAARSITGFGSGVPLPAVETFPFSWISVGTLHIDFSFVLDQLSLVMLLVVTGVGFLIHLYSVGYMHDDPGYARYFSYLNLFLFFMTTLVLAGNVLLMFVGWEGVGLVSYLLIGFWFQKKSAADAGKKAFIVNRIGDFGFLIGIFLLLGNFGTLTFSDIAAKLAANPALDGRHPHCHLPLPAGGRNRQERAASALRLAARRHGRPHARLRAHSRGHHGHGRRLHDLAHAFPLRPFALSLWARLPSSGAATAFFAATMGLMQNDIKRVLAYSTISQLGYMFLGCGVAAYSAAIFHLMTHAFFKALLFLAAGSVIHAMGGEQDMRKMGGLRKKLPITFWTMTAAVFAISGFFPFAGFFSKDAILYAAFLQGTGGKILWFVGLVTALLTAIYMFRLWYMTFFGETRSHDAHPHEAPATMLIPLVILGALSVCGGWIGIERFSSYLAPATGARSGRRCIAAS